METALLILAIGIVAFLFVGLALWFWFARKVMRTQSTVINQISQDFNDDLAPRRIRGRR